MTKPWLKQPGEVIDSKGYPIYPGDLLRSFHYIGPRRKRNYLYHTAVLKDGAMYMIPTMHLESTKIRQGGDCLLSQELANNAEIIQGYGPQDCIDFTDRTKTFPFLG